MKFYHAFPRPSRARLKSSDCSELGYEILRGLLSFGLLLTPEEFSIPPHPFAASKDPPSTTIIQRRACFTLIDRHEILLEGGHRSEFGEFAIGLDTLEARYLGITPTIYYYPNTPAYNVEQRPELCEISMEIVFRLSEIRRILIALATIEAKSLTTSTDYRSNEYLERHGLTLKDEPSVAAALDKLERENADPILQYFATERVSACNAAEWIEIILSMFQTADSATRKRHLAYFAQREWRIIQYFSEFTHCLPLRVPSDAKLNSGAREYICKCLNHVDYIRLKFGLNFNPLDCFVLAGTQRRKFSSFIREIIVPSDISKRTAHLLSIVDGGQWLYSSINESCCLFERIEH